jgi:single-strand DNA-binding protein
MPNFNLTDASGLRCIVGHCGRDPELRHTPGGKRIAKFSMATNHKDKAGNVDTTWHSILAWEEQADAAMHVRKGQVVCVVGKESTREYNGKEYTEITAWFIGSSMEIPIPREPNPPSQPSGDAGGDIPF